MLVRLLGSVDVLDDAGTVVAVGGPKERAVLAALALDANRWISEAQLIDALWPEAPPPTATRTLQKYLSRLRHALAVGALTIDREASGHRLSLGDEQLDALLAQRAIEEAHKLLAAGRADDAEAAFRAAETYFRGPALGDIGQVPFFAGEASRLEGLRLIAVEGRVDAMLEQGRAAEAAAHLEGLCAGHPLHERFFAQHILALYRAGRQAEALRVYEHLRRTLRDELGLEPSSELRSLEQAVLAQSPTLDGPTPKAPGDDGSQRVRLPTERSSFVGREGELLSVLSHLGGTRILTLTGIGGGGKSRLAVRAAHRVGSRYADGVVFVDLASVTDQDFVAEAVAAAIGAHLANPDVDALAEHLAGRTMLLLLDNCEHLLDATAEVVEVVLERCPSVTFIATSREPLGVEGEHIHPVLSLPSDDAIALFIERASAISPESSPTNVAVIDEVCRRLDGIPLAIELAAARVSHMRPEEILEHLEDRFRLLTGGRRRVPRQQTLRAALDWSYELLTPSDQAFLRRLSVFRGTFSLAAAQAVCGGDALDAMRSLTAKSLVVIDATSDGTRYHLLETMRLYAEEKFLAAGEADEYRTRHRDHFLAWIESVSPDELVRPASGRWPVEEADNVRAALDWSREQGRIDLVARLASLTAGYWGGFAHTAELNAWTTYLLDGIDELDASTRAAALVTAAARSMFEGDYAEVERRSADALRTADPDSWVAAWAWSYQTMYWGLEGDERAETAATEGIRAAMVCGVPGIAHLIHLFRVGLPVSEGDLSSAVELLRSGPSIGPTYNMLAALLALLGETDDAQATNDRYHGTPVYAHHFWQFAETLVAIMAGQPDVARHRLDEMVQDVWHHALPLADADCVVLLAALELLDGDACAAATHLGTARAAIKSHFRWHAADATYGHLVNLATAQLGEVEVVRLRDAGSQLSAGAVLDGFVIVDRNTTPAGTRSASFPDR